jgi:hypothetical protein
LRPVNQQFFLAAAVQASGMVTKAVMAGFQHGKAGRVGLGIAGIGAAQGEQHHDIVPRRPRRRFHAGIAGQHDRDPRAYLAAIIGLRIERGLDRAQHVEHTGKLGRLVRQSFAAPVRCARHWHRRACLTGGRWRRWPTPS